MGLKPRFIDYFNYNINTCADLAVFTEEVKKLLDKQFTISAQITAYGSNGSELGNIGEDTQDLGVKPSTSFFNQTFSPLDYSSGNGAGARHSC